MTNLEYLWGYLHDDKECVRENMFVLDPYRYTSEFIDALAKSPDCLCLLKAKIKQERELSFGLFSFLRGGYGQAEYCIIRMMNIGSFNEVLQKYFGDLFDSLEKEKVRLRK